MVEKIDFFTSFGHGEGGDHRQRLGIDTKGPTLLITDLAIWKPDPVTKEFTVVVAASGRDPRAGAGDLRLDGDVRRARLTKRRRRRELELTTLRDLQARTEAAHQGRKGKRMTWPRPISATIIRTPIGRFGGALSSVRADDLGAVPLKALIGAQCRRRLGGGRRRHLRLRQPGRRGQPQRRAHGAAAGRPAGRSVRARPSTGCAARAWMR